MTNQKRTRRKDARPEEIVTAALQVFGEKGFSATSLGEIAQRADISRTTIYLYFDDKEAILRRALEDRLGAAFSSARDHIAGMDAPFAVLFKALLVRMYERLLEPDTLIILKVMIAEGTQLPELLKYYHSNILSIAEGMVGAMIQRGVARRELRPEVLSYDIKLIIAPIIAAAVWRMTFERFDSIDLAGFIDGHVDIILNGLVAPHRPTP